MSANEKLEAILAQGKINSCSEDEFTKVVGLLFEPSPTLVRKLMANRPFASAAWLIDHALTIMQDAPIAEQKEILDAHPRLGAATESMSSSSAREQSHGGQTPPEVLAELARLNNDYETKFGFKFITFVNGRTRANILPEFRKRLESDEATEIQTGLKAMADIARNRFARICREVAERMHAENAH